MKLRRRKTLDQTVELNITAFLNLMVILVPFLLITAVFSRMTVLELTLPSKSDNPQSQEKIDLQLQILIYPTFIDVRDANLGRLNKFDLEVGQIKWKPITDLLVQIKQRFPEETSVSLLLEPSVPYKRLIEVMDHVRSAEIVNITELQEVELFPAISIGKAPGLNGEAQIEETVEAEVVELDVLQSKIQAGSGEVDAQ